MTLKCVQHDHTLDDHPMKRGDTVYALTAADTDLIVALCARSIEAIPEQCRHAPPQQGNYIVCTALVKDGGYGDGSYSLDFTTGSPLFGVAHEIAVMYVGKAVHLIVESRKV